MRCIEFEYDDGRTYLRWAVGNEVDPAVYVTFRQAVSKTFSRSKAI